MVVRAINFAQNEVHKDEDIQQNGDKIGDIALEFARNEERHVENDERHDALHQLKNGGIQSSVVVHEKHDERCDRGQERKSLQNKNEPQGFFALFVHGAKDRLFLGRGLVFCHSKTSENVQSLYRKFR